MCRLSLGQILFRPSFSCPEGYQNVTRDEQAAAAVALDITVPVLGAPQVSHYTS